MCQVYACVLRSYTLRHGFRIALMQCNAAAVARLRIGEQANERMLHSFASVMIFENSASHNFREWRGVGRRGEGGWVTDSEYSCLEKWNIALASPIPQPLNVVLLRNRLEAT